MRTQTRLFIALNALVGVLLIFVLTEAQGQPGGKKGGKGSTETVDDFVNRLMAFTKSKDGKLIKSELTDPRLHALFDRADTNKDGVVTRAELEALFAREKLEGGGFGGGDGKKGKGGPGGDGKKGKGPKGGPPQPGQVLPPFLQDSLNLTEAQRQQLADLQKEVDGKLDKILTTEQKTQLRELSAQKWFGPKFGEKKGPPPDKN